MYVFKSWILDFFQTFTSNDTEQGIINQPDLFCWNYLTYRRWSQATSLLLYSLIKKANESHVSPTLHRFYQENLIFNLITATLSKPVEQHLIKNAFFSDNLVKLKQGERCWRVQSWPWSTQIHGFSSTVWSTPAWDYHNPRISPFRPVGHSREEKSEGKVQRAKLGGYVRHKGDQSPFVLFQKRTSWRKKKEHLKQQRPRERGTLQ